MPNFTLAVPYQIRGDQLADEINIAIGTSFAADNCTFYPPSTVQIPVDVAQVAAVQAIVIAHVPQAVYTDADRKRVARQTGESGMDALPGWATFTAAEAEQWIEDNVTNLASAKTALKAMAKAIVYLRNHSMGK